MHRGPLPLFAQMTHSVAVRDSGSTSSGGGKSTPANKSPATMEPPTNNMRNANGALDAKSPEIAVVKPLSPRLPGTSNSSPGVRTIAAGWRNQRE